MSSGEIDYKVTTKQIKELREATAATPVNAKKALQEAQGDFDRAKEILRDLGQATANKRSGNDADDGVVGLLTEGNFGVIIELNCETDFVARNADFQKLADKILRIAAENNLDSVDRLLSFKEGESDVQSIINDGIGLLKENIKLSRLVSTTGNREGIVAGYVHGKYTDNLGRIACLVDIESSSKDHAALLEIGKKIAVQVVSSSPCAVSVDKVSHKIIADQKKKFEDELSGKPKDIAEKIITGKLKKFYKETVLLEQDFVMDADKTVKQFLDEKGKELGASIDVAEFKLIVLAGR